MHTRKVLGVDHMTTSALKPFPGNCNRKQLVEQPGKFLKDM